MSRNKLIQSIENALVGKLPSEQFDMVIGNVIKVLNDFEITDRCTDIVIRDDANERIMKRYCACLMVDGKSEKTIYQYKRSIHKLSEFLGKPFPEMDVYDIRYYLACEKDRGVSDRSIENTRANLSAFFQWLTMEEMIPKNPCLNIKPIKYKDEVRLPFSDVEMDALRSACKGIRERALIEFLVTSGVRVSELANMEVGDIDFQTLLVHVRHGKGNKERVTFINNVAKKHLQEYLLSRAERINALFCNGKHDPLNAGGIRYILKEIEKRSGVPNVHPHRFRRTFATGLANRGMKVQEIQKLLGHSSLNTTMEYVCTDTQAIKNSYQQFIA